MFLTGAPLRAATTGLFTPADYAELARFVAGRPDLRPTPTHALPALAARLGVAALAVKDETARFGLNAFKLTGVTFAIDRLRASGALTAGSTLVCASEGNHGRAVARAARQAGLKARVYMAHDAAEARVSAIQGEGATVVRVGGSYDDAVRQVVADAAREGWTVVSDTAWPGYEDIPRLIMLGYTRLMDEVTEPFDLVFVQGGVGGLLCAVASWCAAHHPEHRPLVVAVEPLQAACLLASARAGRPTAVSGPLRTAMAGLRNREVSAPAFEALLPVTDAFLAIDDWWAFEAMRALAHPEGGAPAVRAGASGAAALGGLMVLLVEPALAEARERLSIGAHARVLVLVSEGVTDPAVFAAALEAR